MTQLRALLRKIEAASGPSAEIDGALWLEFDGEAMGKCWGVRGMKYAGHIHTKAEKDAHIKRMAEFQSPDYTASIDAALSLVDFLLGVDDPKLCYSYDLGWHCYAHAKMAFSADLHLAVGNPAEMQVVHGQGYSMPLAILAALLNALISQPTSEPTP